MENKTLLPQALAYLNRGWSVIPVGAGKIPLIPWKEFQNRLATIDELVKWWTIFPEAQIGIVTGKISDLTVIDVESDGDFNLVKDETYTVETGGKGRHYYFNYDEDFKNAVKVFPSVDQRSEGGYVIAPPSISQKGPYTVIKDLKVTQMSFQTKNLFTGRLEAKKGGLPWFASSGPSAYPKAEPLEYIGTGQGSRNDSMAKYAGSVMARLHPSLWESIGWKMFEEANKKNSPPLPISELRTTWLSISNKETKAHPEGRRYDLPQEKTWGPDPKQDEVISKKEESETSVEGPDPKETFHASEVAGMQTIDTDHTYPTGMAPFDEALLGGFTLGEVIVVAGQSGHGKTTLIQDWSVTLASGGVEGKEKLPTLWFSYEVLAKPLWQKFQTMGASIETPIYMPRFNETGEIDWVTDVIERAIVKWGIKVVAIDHLGFLRAPRGNYSNAADAITNTVRALKKLAVKRGLIILLPVHVRKTSSKTPDLNDIRDSLGIAQEADTVFFIGREKDDAGLPTQKAKLSLVKNRKTGNSVSATFDFQFGRFFFNDNKKKDSEVEQFSQGSTQPLEDY